MTPLRRTTRDPQLAAARDAFRRVAATVDVAQRALLAAVPTARDPGIPMDEALGLFLDGLARAAELMPAWRAQATDALWKGCARALAESKTEAERLRASGETLGFEAMNARFGDVISPLEEFADAGDELRRLR